MQEREKCCACAERRLRELGSGTERASVREFGLVELPEVTQTIGNSISSKDFR
jgi:hypothetical protein